MRSLGCSRLVVSVPRAQGSLALGPVEGAGKLASGSMDIGPAGRVDIDTSRSRRPRVG